MDISTRIFSCTHQQTAFSIYETTTGIERASRKCALNWSEKTERLKVIRAEMHLISPGSL